MPGDDELDKVLGAGSRQKVGSFKHFIDGDRWEWSDEVAAMHGYEPGSVVPTTELLLSHKHPEDAPRVGSVLERMRAAGEPISSRHRIIDTNGEIRQVVVASDQLADRAGAVVGTYGFYVDVTDTFEDEVQVGVDEAVAEIVGSRAVIEQAKGALMLVYGIPAARAFDILTWRSQESNVKLREIAEGVVCQLVERLEMPEGLRREFDHLLLTAHEAASRKEVAGSRS